MHYLQKQTEKKSRNKSKLYYSMTCLHYIRRGLEMECLGNTGIFQWGMVAPLIKILVIISHLTTRKMQLDVE